MTPALPVHGDRFDDVEARLFRRDRAFAGHLARRHLAFARWLLDGLEHRRPAIAHALLPYRLPLAPPHGHLDVPVLSNAVRRRGDQLEHLRLIDFTETGTAAPHAGVDGGRVDSDRRAVRQPLPAHVGDFGLDGVLPGPVAGSLGLARRDRERAHDVGSAAAPGEHLARARRLVVIPPPCLASEGEAFVASRRESDGGTVDGPLHLGVGHRAAKEIPGEHPRRDRLPGDHVPFGSRDVYLELGSPILLDPERAAIGQLFSFQRCPRRDLVGAQRHIALQCEAGREGPELAERQLLREDFLPSRADRAHLHLRARRRRFQNSELAIAHEALEMNGVTGSIDAALRHDHAEAARRLAVPVSLDPERPGRKAS